MTIPQVADELRKIAAKGPENFEPGELREHLRHLASQLARRRPVRKAEAISTPMSDEVADEIRAYAEAHPGLTQALIAIAFGVNQGRVSEALRGKRS